MASFLQLPRELRDIIYEMTFSNTAVKCPSLEDPHDPKGFLRHTSDPFGWGSLYGIDAARGTPCNLNVFTYCFVHADHSALLCGMYYRALDLPSLHPIPRHYQFSLPTLVAAARIIFLLIRISGCRHRIIPNVLLTRHHSRTCH